ncbi:MAG: hypothetical protein KatS3mg031_2795 [Chitinophagales bacterium]|jgi:hypothetical protein|nr:MAG: hypothetical protein KatS3mg031_2795 [Chitinophagales bacterium]
MDSLQLYERFLMDIDKYQTAVADIEEFNRYAARGLDEFIANRYAEFEMVQKRTDDLRLFVRQATLTRTSQSVPFVLPDDYRHMLLVTATSPGDGCRPDYNVVLKKYTADIKGYGTFNYYYMPSEDNRFYQIIEDRLIIMPDDLLSVYIEYIHQPVGFFIDPSTFQPNGYELPDPVCEQILQIMTRQYRGDVFESAYQISVNETQLKKN